jgi:hypothetical protein
LITDQWAFNIANSTLPASHPRLQYDVEIDIEQPVDQLWNTGNENEGQYSIALEDNSILMNGMIESVEEGGMAYFRLSQDCLIMIESGDSNVKSGDWVNLNIRHEDIEISAQGI